MLTLAAAVPLAKPALAAKESVPDWVREAAALPQASYPPRTDAVVLLDERTYTVEPDGRRTEHVRRVVRILRPEGREYAQMQAYFRGSNRLRYMHVWGIGADGHEYALPDKSLVDRSAGEGFELYSDLRMRAGMAPAADPGAIAAVEYESESKPFENDIEWWPYEPIPVVRERLTVALPPGFEQHSGWKGKPATQPVDVEHGKTLWEVSSLPAERHEGLADVPSYGSLAPRLDVFYYPPNSTPAVAPRADWQQLGLWYEALARDRNRPDAAIAAKAQELVAGKTDFRDRTEAIANYVQQQIRYVAIEIGVGGLQPHAATDIYTHRYGDCKDKATLLSAMLSAVGIHSTWVMVDTDRGVVSSSAPSLAGNHMIAAIELPKDYKPEGMAAVVTVSSGKRFLLFDPTWEKTPFGQIEHNLQGADALLVDGEGSQAIRIPVLDPSQNLVERRGSFRLSADGSLSGTLTEQQKGDIASNRRYELAELDQQKFLKVLNNIASRDLVDFHIGGLKVENAADLSQALQLQYSLQADHFAQQAGPLLMLRPRILGQEGFPLDRAGAKRDDIPVEFGSTRTVHDQWSIELPPEMAVDELPASADVDLGFAAYRSRTTVEGQTLHYDRTFTVRQLELPASRYQDVVKLDRIIATDEQSSAVLKKK